MDSSTSKLIQLDSIVSKDLVENLIKLSFKNEVCLDCGATAVESCIDTTYQTHCVVLHYAIFESNNNRLKSFNYNRLNISHKLSLSK